MKHLLKVLISTLMICLLAFGLTACGGNEGGGEGGGDTHTCSYTEATAWFDASGDKVFVKELSCSCGKKQTKTELEISTADQLVKWASYVNAGNHYSYKVKFVNDINMTGKTYEPLVFDVDSPVNFYKITAKEGGVTISNLNATSNEFAGFIGYAGSKLEISGITIDRATVSGPIAGGFIGIIEDAVEIKLDNCGVTNSNISGEDVAGGFYGKGTSTEDTTVTFNGLTVTSNVINSQGYAGAFAGVVTECEPAQNKIYKIYVNSWTISSNGSNSTSTQENVVGTLFGYLGNGLIQIPELTADIKNANSALLNNDPILREYGRTGWTSRDDEGEYWNGMATIHYDNAVNG